MKTQVEEKRRYKAVANREYHIVEEMPSRNQGGDVLTSEETRIVHSRRRTEDALAGTAIDINKAKQQELARLNMEYRSELPRPADDGGTPTTIRLLKQGTLPMHLPMSIDNSQRQSGYNTQQEVKTVDVARAEQKLDYAASRNNEMASIQTALTPEVDMRGPNQGSQQVAYGGNTGRSSVRLPEEMNATHRTLPVLTQRSPRAIPHASNAMMVNHCDSPPVQPA